MIKGYDTKETPHCYSLVDWAAWKGIDLVHVPNEGKRSFASHYHQKKMGLKKHFPDYILFEPAGRYPLMVFEMKAPGKKPDKGQLQVLASLSRKGYFTAWFDNVDAAILGIEKYMGWKK